MRSKNLTLSLLFGLGVLASAGQALAWGDTGHRLVGEEAMRALPKGLPAFMYAAQSALDVGQYSREPDVWRHSGPIHDADRDPAHLMRLDDDAKTLAGTTVTTMPATRGDYEALVRAHGYDPVKAGYLYYSLSDAYANVRKDFAVLRVIAEAMAREKDKTKIAALKEAERRREDLTLRDIGILSHYAGDATQPMHVSIHYDGWGDYPNPEGFTASGIHWPVEGPYVHQYVTQVMVHTKMAPATPCNDTPEACISQRLQRNWSQVVPFYRLEKTGIFKAGNPAGADYLAGLLARGASDLRDMIGDAWTESPKIPVNSAGNTLEDIKSGKVQAYDLVYGDS